MPPLTTTPVVATDARPVRSAQRNASRAWMLCVIPVVTGLLIALLLSSFVAFPLLKTGSPYLNRQLAVGARLAEGFGEDPSNSSASKPMLVCIGDSITVEGIDASVIEGSAPQWSALNLGISGCNRTGLDVIVPLVAAARPDAICLMLFPDAVVAQFELPADSAYAYRLAGFVDAWPDGWMARPRPCIPVDASEGLESSEAAARMYFRNAPLTALNNALRSRLRSGIAIPPSDEWITPFTRTRSISGANLESNLLRVRSETRARSEGSCTPHEEDLANLLTHLSDAGIPLLLIGAPLHPGLVDDLNPLAERVKAVCESVLNRNSNKARGAFVDARTLLVASEFSDAVHPNDVGRERLSRFIAEALVSNSEALAPSTPPATKTLAER